jgi:kumamolisin
MFGAPETAVSDVEDWATANGLTITSGNSGQLSVELSGTASAFDGAFGTSIDEVQLANGTETYANLTGPGMPSPIANEVQGVVGLDNLNPPQPADLETSVENAREPSATDTCPAPSGADSPADLESAYDFSGLAANDATGFGESIALVEVGAFDPNDIACYQQWFPFQSPTVMPPVGTGPTVPESPDIKTEVTADIETAGALAPDANIDVYEGPDNEQGLLAIYTQIAKDDNDQVVSTSYMACETGDTHSYLNEVNQQLAIMAAEGIEFLAASGDLGSNGGCGPGALGVVDPASQPYATGVGGTSLAIDYTSAGAKYAGETVWNDCTFGLFGLGGCECDDANSSNCASGGGISSSWPAPWWQIGPGTVYANRTVPDVAAAAGGQSKYYEYLNGGWIPQGGTSEAAPLWAALAARVNDYCEGPYGVTRGLGPLNPVLYQIAASGEPGFHNDISGNNSYSATSDLYLATPGEYDLDTGLGSPDASQLAESICGIGAPVISTDGTLSLPDGIVGQAYNTELTTADHRQGTWVVSSASLPSGLSLSGYTVSGTPTTTGAVRFELTFTDTSGQTATALATITIEGSSVNPTWTVTASEAPLPANAATDSHAILGAISCATADTCAAVGGYYDASGDLDGLMEVLSDGTWSATEAPLPPIAAGLQGVHLYSVSCASDGKCVAVGDYVDSLGAHGLVEMLSGASWSALQAPLPADAANTQDGLSLNSISCLNDGHCVSVGAYYDNAGNREGVVLVLSANSWSATEAPLPPDAVASNQSGWLSSVSCASDDNCVAIGNYTNNESLPITDNPGLLEVLSSGGWTASRAPLPPDATSDEGPSLSSVSCALDGTCAVSGSYTIPSLEGGLDNAGLLEVLSGNSWNATEAPVPGDAAGDPDARMSSVSCSTDGNCVGIGTYTDSEGYNPALLEVLSGDNWTATTVPVPANASSAASYTELSAVVCPVAGNCVAVGYFTPGPYEGVVDALSDGSWSVAATSAALGDYTMPEALAEWALSAISCSTAGSCAAIDDGQYGDLGDFLAVLSGP